MFRLFVCSVESKISPKGFSLDYSVVSKVYSVVSKVEPAPTEL